MESYTTVLMPSKFDFEDRKSVFIGQAAPVSTERDALAFIESVKKTYPDATHHVYAYVLRENNTARFTDDREPQGTAGMPVLDSIRKNGLVDTVVVVTRYFGGTLLGTGGLVRAYTAAAIGAIQSAEIVKYDVYSEVKIEVNYSDYQKLSSLFEGVGFKTDNSVYSDKVEIYGRVISSEFDVFLKKAIEITSDRIKIEKIREVFSY